jgi:hypothetical protein
MRWLSFGLVQPDVGEIRGRGDGAGFAARGAHRKRLSNGNPRLHPKEISRRAADIRSTKPERSQPACPEPRVAAEVLSGEFENTLSFKWS